MQRSTLFAAAAILVTLLQPASAFAEEPATSTAQEEEATEVSWYGSQTLTVDAVATSALLAGGAGASLPIFLAGYGAFLAGPPVVHGAHARGGIALADLGVRLAAPLVFAAAGNRFGPRDHGEVFDSTSGVLIGFFAGYTGAIALDAAVFAYEKVPREPRAAWYQLQMVAIRSIDGRTKMRGAGLGGQF
jgi:hypothetical protein